MLSSAFKKGDEEKVLAKEWFRSHQVDPPRIYWSQTKTSIRIEIEPANSSAEAILSPTPSTSTNNLLEYNCNFDANCKVRGLLPLFEGVKNPKCEFKTVNAAVAHTSGLAQEGDESPISPALKMAETTVLVFIADKLPALRGKDSDSDDDESPNRARAPTFWTQLFACPRKTYVSLSWVRSADELDPAQAASRYVYQGLQRPGAEEEYAEFSYGANGSGGCTVNAGDFSDGDE